MDVRRQRNEARVGRALGPRREASLLRRRCADAFGFSMDSSPHSLVDGFQPALLHLGTRHTMAAARRRGATRQEARDRRRAPTNANFAQGAQPPRRPSCSAGRRTDERRDGISPRLSLSAAASSARTEEFCPGLGKRSATPCRREASSRMPNRSQPANPGWPTFGRLRTDLPNG
jgi:hypothetical protein